MTIRTLGKNFNNSAINGYNIPVAVLIAPESNVNGVILRYMATGTANGAPMIGKQKPTGTDDLDDKTHLRIPYQFPLYNDLLIPAGNGLYLKSPRAYIVPVELSWDYLNADGTVA